MRDGNLSDLQALITKSRDPITDVNTPDEETGETPLHIAAVAGNVDVVLALLKAGAVPEERILIPLSHARIVSGSEMAHPDEVTKQGSSQVCSDASVTSPAPHSFSSLIFAFKTLTTGGSRETGGVDGIGDWIHGERLVRLLPKGVAYTSLSYPRQARGDNGLSLPPEDIQYSETECPGMIRVSGVEPNIYLTCSHEYGTAGPHMDSKLTVHFSEYGGLFNKVEWDRRFYDHAVKLPMGLSYGLGFMEPPAIGIPHKSKEEFFSDLDPKLKEEIFPGQTQFGDTVLVFGYYRTASEKLSKSLCQFASSEYTKNKRVIFFVKGAAGKEVLKCLPKESNIHFVTATQHVSEKDWHILSRLATASIATGDTSYSDPFFFDNLLFWNDHKRTEKVALLQRLARWHAPEDVDKARIERVLNHDEDTIKSIDDKFIRDWRSFCSHIRENFTLTRENVAEVVKAGTEIYRILHAKTSEEKAEAKSRVYSLLTSPSILSSDTVDLLKAYVVAIIEGQAASTPQAFYLEKMEAGEEPLTAPVFEIFRGVLGKRFVRATIGSQSDSD